MRENILQTIYLMRIYYLKYILKFLQPWGRKESDTTERLNNNSSSTTTATKNPNNSA